jgi:hemoglobin
MSAEATQPSLYERLGGIYSIACVVDDLIDRVMTDPRLNANPAVNEAHHKVPPPGFKYLVTEMVGWASGGPQKYTGRPMRESHEHLNITPKEWDAFMDDFQQSLDKFKRTCRGAGGIEGHRQQHLDKSPKWRCHVERSETFLAVACRIVPETIRDSSPATAGSE